MNLTTLIKEREKAFDEKFFYTEPFKTDVYEEIKSFNRTTIRKTLEAVKEMCEERMEGTKLTYRGISEADGILYVHAHLTEVLDKMEEV